MNHLNIIKRFVQNTNSFSEEMSKSLDHMHNRFIQNTDSFKNQTPPLCVLRGQATAESGLASCETFFFFALEEQKYVK